MQRCLGSLKGKRQKISQLQEELQLCQGQLSELQGQLDEAKLSTQVRTKLDAGLKVPAHPEIGEAMQINDWKIQIFRQRIFSVRTKRNTNMRVKFAQQIKFLSR